MLKKTASVILIAMMIMLLSPCCFAAEQFSVSENYDKCSVSVSYYNSYYNNHDVSIRVFEYGNDNIYSYVYINQMKTDKEGRLFVEIPLYKYGHYTLTLEPLNSSFINTYDINMYTEEYRDELWKTAVSSADKDEILRKWDEICAAFDLPRRPDYAEENSFAKKLVNTRGEYDFSERVSANITAFSKLCDDLYVLAGAEGISEENFNAELSDVFDRAIDSACASDEKFADGIKSVKDSENKYNLLKREYCKAEKSFDNYGDFKNLIYELSDSVNLARYLESFKDMIHVSQVEGVLCDEEFIRLAGIENEVKEYRALLSTASVDEGLFKKEFKSLSQFKSVFKDLVQKEKENEKKSNGHTSGGGGGGGNASGAIGGGSKNAISEEGNEKYFDDMQNYEWAVSDVTALYKKGIVSGRGQKKFAPAENVTRAEMIKMLLAACGIDAAGGENAFEDVYENDWFFAFVNTGAKCGIILGSDGKFRPNDFVSREDSAVMICRAVKFDTEGNADFNDKDLIADYALQSCARLFTAGIIKGDQNRAFNPKSSLTRAEAAVMINRLCNYMNK